MIDECLDFLQSSESDELSSSSFSSSSSSSSSSEESEPEEYAAITTFIETINRMGDKQFESNFRLNRATALHLIELYAESDDCPVDNHGGRCKIGAEKEMYAFLWYMATTTTYRELGNLFGLRKSSIWKSVNRVMKWLISIGHQFVSWPEGDEVSEATSKFENIPGAIGLIDVCHITITRPKVNGQDYFDRKKRHSISLQGTVTADKKFIDVFCGEPGSLHDARVLRRSQLYDRASANRADLFPNNTFLIADSAYPSLPWLVPVYKNYGNLTDQQKRFNYLLSASRVWVEHAFGLLKGRFRRLLHFTEHHRIGFVVNLVVCACILHNICIDQRDCFDVKAVGVDSDDEESEDDDEDHDFVVLERREKLFHQLMDRNML